MTMQNAAADAGGDADAAALEEEAAEEFLLLDDVVAEVRTRLSAATLRVPRARALLHDVQMAHQAGKWWLATREQGPFVAGCLLNSFVHTWLRRSTSGAACMR